MVSKLTKNPEKRRTGMAVTGPTKVATWGGTHRELIVPPSCPLRRPPEPVLLGSRLDSWGRAGFRGVS